jgi:glyoxylase-like metal-dependent hydrolase (beta-lactamase superfamily II)
MQIEAFHDAATGTLSYVVWDENTHDAIVIDPILDFDLERLEVSAKGLDRVQDFLMSHELRVQWILDTHVHADHLSGAWLLKKRLGCKNAISANITKVQRVFSELLNVPMPDQSYWDKLLTHGEKLKAGSLHVEVRETPGHTPACTSFVIGDAIFVGDALFMPNLGCGRCDFPGGDARALYRSIFEQVYSLSNGTRIFTGHDYPPQGQPFRTSCTVEEAMQHNVMLPASITEDAFVEKRETRDAQLAPPKLLYPSLQSNIRGGMLPDIENNKRCYFKLPIVLRDSL